MFDTGTAMPYYLDMTNQTDPEPELGQHFVTAFVYTVGAGLALMYILGIGGCMPLPEAPYQHGTGGPQKPGQAETIQAVWYDTFGMTSVPPPVFWVEGADLDCGEGQGFVVKGQCAYGAMITPPEGRHNDYIKVAWAWYEGRKPGNTALAHELCHARGGIDGNYDVHHLGSCFAAGGDLDLAVVVLKERGLY